VTRDREGRLERASKGAAAAAAAAEKRVQPTGKTDTSGRSLAFSVSSFAHRYCGGEGR
jgi:hypothetical protein